MRYLFILLLLTSPAFAKDDDAKKFPVPSKAELRSVYEIINEVFSDQIKAAKDAESKTELAITLLTTSATTNDRLEKYALIEQAQGLALQANDLQLYFRTIDAMAEVFQVDKVKQWSGQLMNIMKNQADEATLRQLAEIDFAAINDPAKRGPAGDAWYEFSKKLKGPSAKIAKDQAILHYRSATQSLEGLDKLRAQKRMKECMESMSSLQSTRTAASKPNSARYGYGRIIEVDCTKGLSALEAQKAQRNAAKAYGAPLEISNKLGMRFRFIPVGTFVMGSPKGEPYRKAEGENQHVVKIAKPFYMGVTEVTQAQYWKITGQNPSHFPNKPNNPVEKVTWEAAQVFCEKLSKLDHKRTYRMPTAEQWEYACRAGTLGATYGPLDRIAWRRSNSKGTTQPVAMLAPNAWGLYDCIGNVWNLCSDERDSSALIRGGCWNDTLPESSLRASGWRHWPKNHPENTVGFRVVCTLKQ